MRLLIYKTYLLTWLREIFNAKRTSDESSAVGTPARYLSSGIYAGDRHKHDGGAAAPDKFNGLLRDAVAGIAIRLYSTGWRETNMKGLRKHDYFLSYVCQQNSANEHLDLVKVSAMFAVRLGVRFGRVHGRNAARARLFPWRYRVDNAPDHGDWRARSRLRWPCHGARLSGRLWFKFKSRI